MQDRHIPLGFTLLEILVVLFIVSILSGLVVVNLPQALDTNDTLVSVERLHKVMNRALQRAERESSEYGVLLDERGYQILVFEPISQRWQPSLNHEHRYRTFPPSFRPYLALEEGQQMLGGAPNTSESEGEDLVPQILLLSSGETSIFELLFDDALGSSYLLTGSGFGSVTFDVQSPED